MRERSDTTAPGIGQRAGLLSLAQILADLLPVLGVDPRMAQGLFDTPRAETATRERGGPGFGETAIVDIAAFGEAFGYRCGRRIGRLAFPAALRDLARQIGRKTGPCRSVTFDITEREPLQSGLV